MQSTVMEELELGIVMPTRKAFKPGNGGFINFHVSRTTSKVEILCREVTFKC